MRITPSMSSFSFLTSSTMSPLRIVEFFQSAVVSVFETTYFGIEFILSANPTSSVYDGQAAAKPS